MTVAGAARWPLWAIAWAALNAAVAVVAGAWAAHGVAPQIGLLVQTGSHYALFHALALIGVAVLARLALLPARWLLAVAVLFGLGLLLFPAGVYAAAFQLRLPIAPVGGTLLILGWAVLAVGAVVAGLRRGA